MASILPTLITLAAFIVGMIAILVIQRRKVRSKAKKSQDADELIAGYKETTGLDAARERQEIARKVAQDYPALGPAERRRMAALIQDNLRQRARALKSITRKQGVK